MSTPGTGDRYHLDGLVLKSQRGQLCIVPEHVVAHALHLYLNKSELWKVAQISKHMRSAALVANDMQNAAAKKHYFYQWEEENETTPAGKRRINQYNDVHRLIDKSLNYVKQNDVLVLQNRFYGVLPTKHIIVLPSTLGSHFALRMKNHMGSSDNVTYLVGQGLWKLTWPVTITQETFVNFEKVHIELKGMDMAYVAQSFMIDEQLFWVTEHEMCTWERGDKVVVSHHPTWVSKHLVDGFYRVVKYSKMEVLLFCFYAGFVVPVVIHYNVVTGEFMHIVPTMDRREVTRTFDLTPLRIEVLANGAVLFLPPLRNLAHEDGGILMLTLEPLVSKVDEDGKERSETTLLFGRWRKISAPAKFVAELRKNTEAGNKFCYIDPETIELFLCRRTDNKKDNHCVFRLKLETN